MSVIEPDVLKRIPSVCDQCARSLDEADDHIINLCTDFPGNKHAALLLGGFISVYESFRHLVLRIDDERAVAQVEELQKRIDRLKEIGRDMARRSGS